jgi:hypothetical protein
VPQRSLSALSLGRHHALQQMRPLGRVLAEVLLAFHLLLPFLLLFLDLQQMRPSGRVLAEALLALYLLLPCLQPIWR